MRALSRITSLCLATALGSLSLSAAPAGPASPDLAVDEIDLSGVQCGKCGSEVTVVVKNQGGDFPGGSSLTVELSVTPAGQAQNRKTRRQTSAPPAAGSALRMSFTFTDVLVSSCQQEASVFEAKAYLTGSDTREGNTRNNTKRLAQTIQARCPSGK